MAVADGCIGASGGCSRMTIVFSGVAGFPEGRTRASLSSHGPARIVSVVPSSGAEGGNSEVTAEVVASTRPGDSRKDDERQKSKVRDKDRPVTSSCIGSGEAEDSAPECARRSALFGSAGGGGCSIMTTFFPWSA